MDENLDCLPKAKSNKVTNKVKGDKRTRVWSSSNRSFDGRSLVSLAPRRMCHELSACCDFVSFPAHRACVGDDFELLEAQDGRVPDFQRADFALAGDIVNRG